MSYNPINKNNKIVEKLTVYVNVLIKMLYFTQAQNWSNFKIVKCDGIALQNHANYSWGMDVYVLEWT